MDLLQAWVEKGTDFLMSFLLIVILVGTGIYYTIRLRFIQIRRFGQGCRLFLEISV